MNSWILTAVILAVIFWCVIRTGPRRADRALRSLAHRAGGRVRSGGVGWRSVAVIPHGGGELHVTVRCISWLHSKYSAEFRARWPADNQDVAIAAPMQLVIPGGENRKSAGSDELREAASRLQRAPGVEHVRLGTADGEFRSEAVLTTTNIDRLAAWFDATLRLRDLLMAETAGGIEFLATRAAADSGASCQVCGIPPEPSELVYCKKCGTPHHADCWKYNRGCAIYGCKG